MKIALCFPSLKLFDFALLRQGQFLQRIGKVEKDLKKGIRFNKQAYLYIYKFYEFRYTGLVEFHP